MAPRPSTQQQALRAQADAGSEQTTAREVKPIRRAHGDRGPETQIGWPFQGFGREQKAPHGASVWIAPVCTPCSQHLAPSGTRGCGLIASHCYLTSFWRTFSPREGALGNFARYVESAIASTRWRRTTRISYGTTAQREGSNILRGPATTPRSLRWTTLAGSTATPTCAPSLPCLHGRMGGAGLPAGAWEPGSNTLSSSTWC